MAAALSFLVVFVGAHHTETRSATGPDASPIVTMAFSLCVAVGDADGDGDAHGIAVRFLGPVSDAHRSADGLSLIHI